MVPRQDHRPRLHRYRLPGDRLPLWLPIRRQVRRPLPPRFPAKGARYPLLSPPPQHRVLPRFRRHRRILGRPALLQPVLGIRAAWFAL